MPDLASVTIDLEQVRNLAVSLGRLNGQIQARAPAALEVGGDYLYRQCVSALAVMFPEVPPAAIEAALDTISATDSVPVYTLRSDATGVPYVRWRTQRDEKVCRICGPRDGQVYPLEAIPMLYPAHPNCRCDIDRLDIGTALLSVAPAILPDAMTMVANDLLQDFATMWTRAG